MRGRAHHQLSLIRGRLTLGLDQIHQLHMNLGDNLVPGRSEWKLGYSRKGALWILPTPSLPSQHGAAQVAGASINLLRDLCKRRPLQSLCPHF